MAAVLYLDMYIFTHFINFGHVSVIWMQNESRFVFLNIFYNVVEYVLINFVIPWYHFE